jgi:hypothetical protein
LSSALCEPGILTPVLPVRTNPKALGVRKHVFQQLAARRVWARVGKLNGLLNNVVDLLLDVLQLRFSCKVLFNDVLLQGCDGVPCSIVGFLICAQSGWSLSNKLLGLNCLTLTYKIDHGGKKWLVKYKRLCCCCGKVQKAKKLNGEHEIRIQRKSKKSSIKGFMI